MIILDDCTDVGEDCPRIFVNGQQDGFDGFYERVIGEKRDDRFVYKHVSEDYWLHSNAFRWVFTNSYTSFQVSNLPNMLAVFMSSDVVSKHKRIFELFGLTIFLSVDCPWNVCYPHFARNNIWWLFKVLRLL